VKKVITTNQTEISSSGAADKEQKDIHLRDLKGIISGPEILVSVEGMNNSIKGAVNKASGFDDQSGE